MGQGKEKQKRMQKNRNMRVGEVGQEYFGV